MVTIHFIRHGDKQPGKANPPLTQEGIRKAESTAQYLGRQKIHMILSSPMKRTQQTAAIIANYLSMPVIVEDRLVERMELDIGNGESMNEFMDEWRKTIHNRHYQPIHGDSSFAKGNKVQLLIEEITHKKDDITIVMVTHGGTIADVLQNIFKENELQFISDEQVQYIDITECSITTIIGGNGKYQLAKLASIEHLKKK